VLANAPVIHPRSPGSNFGIDRKKNSYSVYLAFEIEYILFYLVLSLLQSNFKDGTIHFEKVK
jgi:hypothetical protein